MLTEVGEGADPEDPDEYLANNVVLVPAEARWQTLQDNGCIVADRCAIGTLDRGVIHDNKFSMIDEVMMNLAILGMA